jgi:arylsulfatase A-like enzyme
MVIMEKPQNIILFLTDDHAQWALGCNGNTELRTPNLDYLSDSGVNMLNAFTPVPVCSPARACLLTGRLASQHGLHDYLKSSDPQVKITAWLKDETTLAQILSDAGYQTGLSGKWHLGDDIEPQPGFDYWFCTGIEYPIYHQGPHTFRENGEPVRIGGQITQPITEHALKFLRNLKEAPFFLVIGHYATHSPWSGHPERLVESYRDCSFADIPDDTMYPFGRQNLESTDETRNQPKEAKAQYYAAVTQIDEGVGRVIDELDALGLRDDTLIVYTSDHGLNCGHHGIWGKGNGTLPLNMVEESIRVPLIFNHPGTLYGRQLRKEFVDHTDVFQTLLDYAGIALSEESKDEKSYPGRSFLPLLVNESFDSGWRTDQFCEYGNVRMVRTPTHKLVRRHPDGPNELFDLQTDPRELVNLYSLPEQGDLVAHMTEKIDRFFAKYEDPTKSGLRVQDLPRHNDTEAWRNP